MKNTAGNTTKRNFKAGNKDIEIEFDEYETPIGMSVDGKRPVALESYGGRARSGPNHYSATDGSYITQTTSFTPNPIPLKYTDENGKTTELKEVNAPGIQSKINLTNQVNQAVGTPYQASQDPKINDKFDLTNTPDGTTASIRMRTGNDGVSRFSLQLRDAQGMMSEEMQMPVTQVAWSKSDPTTVIYQFDDGASLSIPRNGGHGVYIEADGTKHGATSENALKDSMTNMSRLRQENSGPDLQTQMEQGAQRRREQTQPAADEFAPPRVYKDLSQKMQL